MPSLIEVSNVITHIQTALGDINIEHIHNHLLEHGHNEEETDALIAVLATHTKSMTNIIFNIANIYEQLAFNEVEDACHISFDEMKTIAEEAGCVFTQLPSSNGEVVQCQSPYQKDVCGAPDEIIRSAYIQTINAQAENHG